MSSSAPSLNDTPLYVQSLLSPQVNPSTVDWPLQAALSGGGFTRLETVVVKALTTTCYPLTFHPHKEGVVEVCGSFLALISPQNLMTIFIHANIG